MSADGEQGGVLYRTLNEKWVGLDKLYEAEAIIRVLRQALQDIAGAEAIPNDAVAFVWCRDVARATLAKHPTSPEDAA